MTDVPNWWKKPRVITVVVDNDSWILPFAERLIEEVRADCEDVRLARTHDAICDGAVAFYLGCTRITPPEVLARNRRNLVIHASDLPRGRGFSPMTWMVLEGHSEIPVCLLEAAAAVDAGPIIYRTIIALHGHELNDEIRQRLGAAHVDLCRRFLRETYPPTGLEQEGEPDYYRRRRPEDSRLDPHKTIADQFDLLRVVDNERYPAFFDHRGQRYKVKIEKWPEDQWR